MSDFSTDQGAPEAKTDQLTFQVGEREYDASQAATKIQAADDHILKIEQENAGYKEQLAAAKLELASSTSVQDALQQLQSATPQENQTIAPTEAMSAEQIGEIANKQLLDLMNQRETVAAKAASEALSKSTFATTKAKLVEQFGDKTEQVMNEKATSLGISIEQLILKASDPVDSIMLLENLKVSSSVSQAAPSSGFNTSNLASKAPEGKEGWYKGSSNDIMNELQRRLKNS